MTVSIDTAFYKNIMEQARDIILVVSTHGDILHANCAAVQAYGYVLAELQAMHIKDLRAPETRDFVGDQMMLAHESGILFRTIHMRRNGERFPVEVNSRRLALQEDAALVSVVRDISEAVAMETALQQSEAKHRLLLGELYRQNILLSSLHQTALYLMQSIELNEVLATIATRASELIGTPHCYISMVNEPRGVFERKIGLGHFARDESLQFKLNEGIAGQVYKTGEIIVSDDYSTCTNRLNGPFFDQLHAIALVPLKSKNQVIGAFCLAFLESEKRFCEQEISLLNHFAELASIALVNAILISSYKAELAQRKQAEDALQKSQADNVAIITAIPDPLFILDRHGTFIKHSASQRHVDWLPENILGKTVTDVFPVSIAQSFLAGITTSIQTNEIQIFEYQLTQKDQAEYYEARIVVSEKNEVLAMIRNITEQKNLQFQLEHLSLHDPLTGLYNRACFEEEMKRRERLQMTDTGIIVCDVDGLKMVNDSFGHAMGDTILQVISVILKLSFRSSDLVARIGGDEFAILLSCNSEEILKKKCTTITEKIRLYNADNPTVPISLSIGWAMNTQTPIDMIALFKKADNSMYREKLHRKNSARNIMVQALIKALEARDYITDGHSDRLQALIELLGRARGVPESAIADLRLLARFHDIGKVGIPDDILFKPGPLNEQEWEILRQHCEIGYRIASGVPDLVPIAKWILAHHEWWNGQGYPLGLSGEVIPLECRILAIVDGYDAMTSDRPYRKAMSADAALSELQKCAGSQFDPILVDLFIECITQSSRESS
ncbi:diguanylate cyclase [Sporomusa aerivorans]|uniref:sensor domain-containing diguanylate cyclase/phosphohydrolase n=1 Tax=Sporomusa aerivorans TaxID=204936 RepID=UPI00352B1F3D